MYTKKTQFWSVSLSPPGERLKTNLGCKTIWKRNMAAEVNSAKTTFFCAAIVSCTFLWPFSESSSLTEVIRPHCSPTRFYEDGRCRQCYHFCRAGCTGPGSHVGAGGCNSCLRGKELPHDPSVIKCISNFTPCQTGSYLRRVPLTDRGPLAGFMVCKLCHPLCATCSGPGAPYCLTCKYYKMDGRCVRSCPRGSDIDHVRRTCNRNGRHRRRHTSSYRYSDVTDI